VDEDIAMGPDCFLTVDSTRKWINNPSKSSMPGPNQVAPMTPMQDNDGEILKRTICGTKNFFSDAMKIKLAKEK
jgi:hypothetical protein